ncbi:hypothetical protein ACH4E8_08645 [Streptomyces sp. NPDC017979]|uniref:hypothetical protein n=1 Tax=Streptomyces sp. NPDC017979 TaxID=3365024 RepID=UPI003793B94B
MPRPAGRARKAARRARVPFGAVVGGDGATASGGQRQRLLLARALLAATDEVVRLDAPAGVPAVRY